jgi:hypothetical protein
MSNYCKSCGGVILPKSDNDEHDLCEKMRIEREASNLTGEAVLCSSAVLGVVDAAFSLSKFTKSNSYPEHGSEKFFEFTGLCHKLECALRAAGYETATKGVKCSG